MKKTVLVLALSAAFATSAYAAEDKYTTPTATGSEETTTKTSHNPLTGNDTTTTETVTKDQQGHKTGKRTVKTKRDGKSGDVIEKNVDSERQ